MCPFHFDTKKPPRRVHTPGGFLAFYDVGDEPKQILEYLRNLHALVDVLGWIASRFDKAVDRAESMAAIDDILRELQEYLTSSVDRIDATLLSILQILEEMNGQQEMTPQAKANIEKSTADLADETIKNRIRSLKFQKKQQYDNLNWWEEQSAKYGTGNPEIHNHINETRKKIAEIEQMIINLQQQGNEL